MIRELATIDILLNELGLASYFTELTDAQSHLIEAFGYASNKVESAISKLRGTDKENKKEEKEIYLKEKSNHYETSKKLEEAFRRPPAEARPHTWWHWMNGNVTADGITRDLEVLANASLFTALIGVEGCYLGSLLSGEDIGRYVVCLEEEVRLGF